MSFILESIKQAERERKLGKQAPSISIEYTSSRGDRVEHNWLKWVLLSLALIITAIVVCGATYYFANKDRQYIQELSVSSAVQIEDKTSVAKVQESTNVAEQSITMRPVKNEQQPKLKSVKLISAEDDVRVVQGEKTVESGSITKVAEKNIAQETNQPSRNNLSASKLDIGTATKTVKQVSTKQEPAAISSDLAESPKESLNVPEKYTPEQNDLAKDIDEELVQIETASFVEPATTVNKPEIRREEKVSPAVATSAVVPKHVELKAAVNTGVPGFDELPYDVQEQIPDFNVSVHMFHPDPVQRRIRINGQMYTEGKNLQQDLALLEITRYGAIFDYQGHVFRLNVR